MPAGGVAAQVPASTPFRTRVLPLLAAATLALTLAMGTEDILAAPVGLMLVGIVIAALVLLPEGLAALDRARPVLRRRPMRHAGPDVP